MRQIVVVIVVVVWGSVLWASSSATTTSEVIDHTAEAPLPPSQLPIILSKQVERIRKKMLRQQRRQGGTPTVATTLPSDTVPTTRGATTQHPKPIATPLPNVTTTQPMPQKYPITVTSKSVVKVTPPTPSHPITTLIPPVKQQKDRHSPPLSSPTTKQSTVIAKTDTPKKGAALRLLEELRSAMQAVDHEE